MAMTLKHAATYNTAGKPGQDSNIQVLVIRDVVLVLLIISLISGAFDLPEITKA